MKFSFKLFSPLGMIIMLNLMTFLNPQLKNSGQDQSMAKTTRIDALIKEDGLRKIIFKPINIITTNY